MAAEKNRSDEQQLRSHGTTPDRAAPEIAPRETETGTGKVRGTTPMGTQRAVNTNRPADIVNQAGIGDTTDVSAPRMSPNVLQRPYAVGDSVRGGHTPGEDIVEGEAEELAAHRGDATT